VPASQWLCALLYWAFRGLYQRAPVPAHRDAHAERTPELFHCLIA
jgi:hypothetical protein